MIKIINKQHCCGCSACVQRCPKCCISMQEDEEGFLYPIVDLSICIECGLCEVVCPVINPYQPRVSLSVYASKNPNDQVRLQSSSGGVFTMLAEQVVEAGGVVFGAKWNEKWEVVHGFAETKSDIGLFRGSKYVQSRIGTSYADAERFLKSGRRVLFSGTPCQVAGLRKYLRKEFDNLLTVDFICHGVPSPGVFRWYLQEELNQFAHRMAKNMVSFQPVLSIPQKDVLVPDGFGIENIRFRDKRKGWKKFSFTLDLTEASVNGEKKAISLSSSCDEHPFLKGFLADLYLRPSCHACPSKMMRSGSDITLADFWEVDAFYKKINDDKGISKIFINSSKGKDAFFDLGIEKFDIPVFLAMKNRMIVASVAKTKLRDVFFEKKNNCFCERVALLTSKPINIVILETIRHMIPKILVDKLRVLKYIIKSLDRS